MKLCGECASRREMWMRDVDSLAESFISTPLRPDETRRRKAELARIQIKIVEDRCRRAHERRSA